MIFMDETKIAIQAARDAGKVVMQYFNEGFSVETKTDNTPVTQADLAANEIILNAGMQSKAALIGRNKRRLLEMQKIVHDFFGMEFRII